MRAAMETVASDRLLLVKFIGQTVEVGLGGKRMVEGGIEYRDVRDGGKDSAHLPDPGQHHWIMQRGQRSKRFHRGKHFVGQEGSFRDLFTTVHDTMRAHAYFARP